MGDEDMRIIGSADSVKMAGQQISHEIHSVACAQLIIGCSERQAWHCQAMMSTVLANNSEMHCKQAGMVCSKALAGAHLE